MSAGEHVQLQDGAVIRAPGAFAARLRAYVAAHAHTHDDDSRIKVFKQDTVRLATPRHFVMFVCGLDLESDVTPEHCARVAAQMKDEWWAVYQGRERITDDADIINILYSAESAASMRLRRITRPETLRGPRGQKFYATADDLDRVQRRRNAEVVAAHIKGGHALRAKPRCEPLREAVREWEAVCEAAGVKRAHVVSFGVCDTAGPVAATRTPPFRRFMKESAAQAVADLTALAEDTSIFEGALTPLVGATGMPEPGAPKRARMVTRVAEPLCARSGAHPIRLVAGADAASEDIDAETAILHIAHGIESVILHTFNVRLPMHITARPAGDSAATGVQVAYDLAPAVQALVSEWCSLVPVHTADEEHQRQVVRIIGRHCARLLDDLFRSDPGAALTVPALRQRMYNLQQLASEQLAQCRQDLQQAVGPAWAGVLDPRASESAPQDDIVTPARVPKVARTGGVLFPAAHTHWKDDRVPPADRRVQRRLEFGDADGTRQRLDFDDDADASPAASLTLPQMFYGELVRSMSPADLRVQRTPAGRRNLHEVEKLPVSSIIMSTTTRPHERAFAHMLTPQQKLCDDSSLDAPASHAVPDSCVAVVSDASLRRTLSSSVLSPAHLLRSHTAAPAHLFTPAHTAMTTSMSPKLASAWAEMHTRPSARSQARASAGDVFDNTSTASSADAHHYESMQEWHLDSIPASEDGVADL